MLGWGGERGKGGHGEGCNVPFKPRLAVIGPPAGGPGPRRQWSGLLHSFPCRISGYVVRVVGFVVFPFIVASLSPPPRVPPNPGLRNGLAADSSPSLPPTFSSHRFLPTFPTLRQLSSSTPCLQPPSPPPANVNSPSRRSRTIDPPSAALSYSMFGPFSISSAVFVV